MKWNDPIHEDSIMNFVLIVLTLATSGLGVIIFLWLMKKLLVE